MKASSAVHGCALVRDIKSHTINPAKQTTMRCALAVAIAQDRRTTANFLIEDSSDTEATVRQRLRILIATTRLSLLCGADHGVAYQQLFMGHKALKISSGTIGCACLPPLHHVGRKTRNPPDLPWAAMYHNPDELEPASRLERMRPYPGRQRNGLPVSTRVT